ncbi:MAG: hypothetical protein IGQ88_06675 [Gloeomargaritaceae cyanobacterium C42_A2020_066]|nr:hypothetical protein [Gloeomargaritaceae cyanobacterium C42_A2020_066]
MAIWVYRLAALLSPQHVQVRLILGQLHQENQSWNAAETCFHQVLNLEPRHYQATCQLGILANAQQKYAEALPYLSITQAENPPCQGAEQAMYVRHYRDALHNQSLPKDTPRILVLRHPYCQTNFYQIVLDWAKLNCPEILYHFELRILPCETHTWPEVSLHIPWLQDPVQQWSTKAYAKAQAIAEQCRSRNIPIINPVDKLLNATKLAGSCRIAQAGLRTPKMVAITNLSQFKQDLGNLKLPLFIREDWGHGGKITQLDTEDEVSTLTLEGFVRPIAVERVDAQSKDGLYRKYRYIVAGQRGISHHLMITPNWITRGEDRLFTEETRAEELAYIQAPDPNHSRFQAALEKLELDFVAFDYGYDKNGDVIVWEANPFPFIHFSGPDGLLLYRQTAIHRTLAAMLALYLERAGLAVPEPIRVLLSEDPSTIQSELDQLQRP